MALSALAGLGAGMLGHISEPLSYPRKAMWEMAGQMGLPSSGSELLARLLGGEAESYEGLAGGGVEALLDPLNLLGVPLVNRAIGLSKAPGLATRVAEAEKAYDASKAHATLMATRQADLERQMATAIAENVPQGEELTALLGRAAPGRTPWQMLNMAEPAPLSAFMPEAGAVAGAAPVPTKTYNNVNDPFVRQLLSETQLGRSMPGDQMNVIAHMGQQTKGGMNAMPPFGPRMTPGYASEAERAGEPLLPSEVYAMENPALTATRGGRLVPGPGFDPYSAMVNPPGNLGEIVPAAYGNQTSRLQELYGLQKRYRDAARGFSPGENLSMLGGAAAYGAGLGYPMIQRSM